MGSISRRASSGLAGSRVPMAVTAGRKALKSRAIAGIGRSGGAVQIDKGGEPMRKEGRMGIAGEERYSMNRRQSWNMILLFVLLIYGMAAATLIKPEEEFSEAENRTLAKRPKATAGTVFSGEFEEDYEKYLTDQFPLRDGWIGLKTGAERLSGRTESKDIYFAADNYLIEKHTDTFTAPQAAQNIQTLQSFAEQSLGRFGPDRVTVMVIPNAVDILRDKLPAFASPCDQEAYLDELAASLPEGVWFDASAILEEHSQEELYYRTDHHWKTLAAFYVYQAWAGEQGFAVPALTDYEIETVTDSFQGTVQSKLGIRTEGDTIELFLPDHDIFYTVQHGDDPEVSYSLYDYSKLDTKDKYAVYFGGNEALTRLRVRTDSERRLLVVKDSYAHCFIPFLLEEFQQVDVLDIRYYNQKVSDLMEENGYTDLLFLYNASGFAEDTSLRKLLS